MPTDFLLRLHPYLARRTFYPLAGCTLLAGAFLGVRWRVSHTHHFNFLLWNLFLAWVPYICAIWADHWSYRGRRWLALSVPASLWLLFLPNAPYIVTDFKHLLAYRSEMPLWFDIGLLATFAWTGCLLALVSLHLMHNLVRARLGSLWGWAAVLGVAGLCGLGVYVGRFLRWNSWDAFTKPHHVLAAFSHALADPLGHRRAIGMSLMFAAFMLTCYITFISARPRRAGWRQSSAGAAPSAGQRTPV